MCAWLGACAAISKGLGFTQDLHAEKVRSIALATVAPLCPGGAEALAVVVTLEDGRVLKTVGTANGRVTWDSFRLRAARARVTDEGVLSLSEDPRSYLLHPPELTVTAVDHPDKHVQLTVPVREDCALRATYSGEHGREGHDGKHGASKAASVPGEDGEQGGDGGSGKAAPNLTLRATKLVAQDRAWLEVEITAEGQPGSRHFVIDPANGHLTVEAKGGDGGPGGKGGDGGSPGGKAGPPGNGGDGGHGANVKLLFDPSAKELLSALTFHLEGGAAGKMGTAGKAGSGEPPKKPLTVLGVLGAVADALVMPHDGDKGEDGRVDYQESTVAPSTLPAD